jgi:hypothetical protein
MTPKEKAMQIFNRMCNSVHELLPFDVKECALIAVDEIINTFIDIDPKKVYWQEVKQEIENL